ncbi:hypothetical protein LUZ61_005811 [Rhynchospora tenuis]|uniref:Kinesin-like protein n=1 Tax=Rhynchospora tenuis TaxID=198213 RepID=A0AAD5ZQD4_9POAL|nr:hypothetical protein LUZ61_005811 [Rhynchospora tenuis]
MDVDHTLKPREIDLVTIRVEKATARRYEAATWLKNMGATELPETPSEKEFKFFLKNGIILCNVLNKIYPGAVSQVVEDPAGSTAPEEVAALCAYQHFENLRNFLVAVQDLGLPTFEPSDLQQEGTTLGVVNCILALKSYTEVKKLPPKIHGQSTPSVQGRYIMRKNSGLFRSSSVRNSILEKSNINVDYSTKSLEMNDKDKQHSFSSKIAGLNMKCTSFEWQKRQIQDLKHALQDLRNGMENVGRQQSEEIARLGKDLHEVAKAALGYQKVMEENRKLYNQVMDLKGNIRVYCRVRPFFPGQSRELSTIGLIEEGKITIVTSKNGKEGFKTFNFNKVFSPSATQQEVFSDMRPLIRSVLDGYNICIFAYGQTGSGKTHTMSGPKEITETSMGVNYRALNDLFYIVENRRENFSYEISVQMIEIYNEQVRDLLSKSALNQRLEIRSNPQNGLAVPDANVITVQSTSDVIELMKLGQTNRAVGATAMNDRSSRSHSCLTIHVKGRELASGTILHGCMHLIDLAGSERVEKSEARGDRLKEAQHINKSLSALGDVISSLAQRNSHVPYRNSKLTQLLQGSLGGQAKTLMFVHVSPEVDALGETLSTLNFAERVSSVELGAARANKESTEVKGLKEEVVHLKEELAGKNKENEMLKNMIASLKVYGAGPNALSSHITPHTKSTKITEAKGRKSLPLIKKSNSYTEDKLSTDSDSSSTWRGSSNSFNNNNYNALNDQELGPGLDALEMHPSDLSSDNSRHTIPKLVMKKPREKLKRSSELRASKISRNHDLLPSQNFANGPKVPSGRQVATSLGTVVKASATNGKSWK